MLPPEADQRATYDLVAAPVVAAALGGCNGTVFAYGQTGTGKTHTVRTIFLKSSTAAPSVRSAGINQHRLGCA